ncbi:hypothetical protein LEN26_001866 [Aphanomyces euteiches]|nr:hypothetical protein AeMF1_021732 [Aphanomyces euteiches]KAH9160407.1 hypothetical protein LEN26_001866 [Aphanomyces euteiches]KAH9197769.1 hypothetical protein AeNC1_000284 [Aphanomyces euteiches]
MAATEESTAQSLRLALQPKRSSKRTLDAVASSKVDAAKRGAAHAAAITRYLNAARALFSPVKHDDTWKSLENPFGFTSALDSTESLRHFKSPLRPPHVLDSWTPYQIALFELGISQFGKKFHMIQQLIPAKSTRDVVLFYYTWKKCGLDKATWGERDAAKDPFGMKRMKKEREAHGIVPTAYDLMSDEDDSTTLAVKQVQETTTEFFAAVRELYAATAPPSVTLDEFDLRLPQKLTLVPMLSVLRPPHVLDAWSPWELGVFECGLRLHGKQFHAISNLLPSKTTQDVVALYYVWKVHSPVYVEMKRSWPPSIFGRFDPTA